MPYHCADIAGEDGDFEGFEAMQASPRWFGGICLAQLGDGIHSFHFRLARLGRLGRAFQHASCTRFVSVLLSVACTAHSNALGQAAWFIVPAETLF